MSDGPHRSLPMPPHWKQLAERAASPAYTSADVDEVLPIALKKDFLREAPLAEITQVLCGEEQGSLFQETQAERLETLRDANPGSVPADTLIDCAIDALSNGLRGDEAARTALAQALQSHARSRSRQIVEHYHRAGGDNPDPSDRLRAARTQLPYSKIASELMSAPPSARDLQPTKYSGVDEGPPL